ncbi:TPA: MFS transporter [Candidatus Bathyarchaeota archaeon]|nr:MFS transporter [Candidatus Bathyarchaeota archaeon]
MPSAKRNLSLLFVINISAAIYLNMTRVFIPLFIRGLQASVFEVSLVLFVSNASSTITMMLGGHLSDKYGRKKAIMLSGILWIIAPLLYISAKSWPETMLYTAVFSIAFSFFVPARAAMIMDIARKSSAGKIYGLMNIAWPIGGLLGPFLGGMIADRYGWAAFFYFLCFLAFTYMLTCFFLTESAERSRRIEEKKFKIPSGQIALILLFFILMHILANTSRGILSAIFPFYLTDRFGKTKTEVGAFFSIEFGLATLIAQVPGGFLADSIGRKKTMVYSILPIPLLSILFIVTSDYLLILLIYMGITSLWSATWPASTAYITDISPSGKKGLMVGVRLTSVRLGFTIGPLIGGFLWDNFDVSLIFYVLALFMAASLLMALLLREEAKLNKI